MRVLHHNSSEGAILMKRALGISLLTLVIELSAWAAPADGKKDVSDEVRRMDAAATVLTEVMGTPDKGIPEEILESAKCVAVVPSMLQGGLVIGANYGKGIATCRTPTGWSAPAPFKVAGGSIGLQIGGEAADVVMVIMNDKGMKDLLSSKFKLGVDASVAAGPVGRHAEGDTDWKMRAEVLSYSRARGVFAGIALDGAAITQDEDETQVLYGEKISFHQILTGGVPAPSGSGNFLAAVKKYTEEARAAKAETR
jgi:SH3 domain-containing YSC84-like protein 1